MIIGYFVSVTDKAGAYLYGPFDTLEDAQKWVDEWKDQFTSRIIHIIDKTQVYSPDNSNEG